MLAVTGSVNHTESVIWKPNITRFISLLPYYKAHHIVSRSVENNLFAALLVAASKTHNYFSTLIIHCTSPSIKRAMS